MRGSAGVHAAHCCKWHGCKYGDPGCPVVNGEVEQEYPCEYCSELLGEEEYYIRDLDSYSTASNNSNRLNVLEVKVGSVLHPMEDKHNISFVYVETTKGGQRKSLEVGKDPVVSFTFVDDKPLNIFAYCNLHGLWKTEVK